MTGRSVHRTHVPNDARGIALAVVLLVMGLLSVLGITFLTISLTESTIVSNETNMTRAFNIAEAGLERAKARVRNGPEASLNNFLPALNNPGPTLYNNVAFDTGTYRVVIEDDNDDGNQDTDINNRVLIRSTGTFGTAQRQILVLVEKPPLGPLGSPRGAAETLTTSGEMHGDPGGSFDGRDWTAPANISGCGDIAGCGAGPGAAVTRGAFSNLTSMSFDLSGSGVGAGTMYGTGCIVQACATDVATASRETDATIPLNRWDSTINQLIPMANQTFTGAALEDNTATYTWGTTAVPKITVINNSADVDWSATVNGVGVLIIDTPGGGAGASQNLVFSNGQLNWEGLVIIRSAGEVQFEIANAAGRIRVFGQLVNTAVQRAEIELNKANNFIKYSSVAMTRVRGFLPAPFTVRSWREVAIQ